MLAIVSLINLIENICNKDRMETAEAVENVKSTID